MSRRRRMLEALDDDIRDHIARETAENIERGMSPDQAHRAALLKFGNITLIKQDTRDVWSSIWLEQLLQDLRYATRMIRRYPGFALVVILTLALGIGMNTAIFSVVNAVLLRPLSYPDPGRLVWLGNYDAFLKRDQIPFADFYEWRARARSFAGMAEFGRQLAALKTAHDASQVSGVVIAGDFWKLTGARPALGRLFNPEEQDAVVLAWDLFQQEFGGDPNIVGASATLDGRPVTITGVLPESFRFQFPVWWQSERAQPVAAYMPLPKDEDPRFRAGTAFAALQPDVSPHQALAEMQTLEKQIQQSYSGRRRFFPTGLSVEPLQERLVRDARPALLVLLAAGGFVLLIGCANIANLLLARATTRRREIALRAAVGAGRTRVIRQLLVESMVLALAGAAAGLAIARFAIAFLVRLSPNAVPRLAEIGLDGRVLLFSLGISTAAALLFGAGPAISLWRTNLHHALKDGVRGSEGIAGFRIRRLLVAAELAMAIVLLTGAGLMMKSFWRMDTLPEGFTPEKVLLMKIRLAGPQYTERGAQQAYVRELLRRVEAVPGVEAAGVSDWFGFSGAPAFPADSSPDQTHVIRLNAASPGFMKAVRMHLLKGRWLKESDPNTTVLLNESMAREAFGAADPIGQVLKIPQPATIVGVIADLKYTKLDAAAPSEIYVTYQEIPFFRGTDLAVRTAGDPTLLASVIRKLILDLDSTQPVFAVRTLEQSLAESITPRRFNLYLLCAFAAAALLLAAVGIYGVIAFSVAERTREIGVRMALGAGRRQVVRMVIVEGMAFSLAGIIVGMIAALALTRLMESLLYEVRPNDPLTFAAVGAALAATALLACWGPALKAALVDPIVALRYE